jgi:hypothetical protein
MLAATCSYQYSCSLYNALDQRGCSAGLSWLQAVLGCSCLNGCCVGWANFK